MARSKNKPVDDARAAMYRELIVGAGERAFAEHGYADARMQEIAADAGISLKTLYQFFPGKDALYQGIKNVRGQAMLAQVESAVGTLAGRFAEEPLDVILQAMEIHLRFFMDHPDYLKLNLHEGYAWFDEQARPDPGQQELWQRGRTIIEDLFRFAIDAGVFVPQPPGHLLTKLISQQQTLLANWVAEGADRNPADVIATAKAEFVRFFCVPAVAAAVLTADGASVAASVPGWRDLVAVGGGEGRRGARAATGGRP